jgi:hypothetical protein
MDTEKRQKLTSVFIFLLICLVLVSCTGNVTVSPSPTPPITIVPPTLTSTAEPLPIVPTSTPSCVDGLTFVNDVTIPDFSVIAPGSTLDKQWLVQNSGTCNWDKRYLMRLISGDLLGAPAEQALYPARAGSQATLRILFTAPAEPGEYVSEWQAFGDNGIPFGDTFFIKIIVQ